MRVEIKTSDLIFDIRNKSHLEVASISDAEARYKVEAGTEKREEIKRDIIEAQSLLLPTILRFVETDDNMVAGAEPYLPEYIVYEFKFAPRRFQGKPQVLADAIQSYLSHMALSLFYRSVDQAGFAEKHSQIAVASMQNIERLCFSKNQPFILR